jgi:flagellar L-ring protein precursor FlgH
MRTAKVLVQGMLMITMVAASSGTCGAYDSLFSDVKAKQVGDVVTVVIVEKTLASNSSKSSTGKDTRFSTQGEEGTGGLDFIPGFSVGANISKEHEGTGVTERRGSIVGRMAARVVGVTDNGCLRIQGEREIVINDEKEMLVLTGVVRPEDISTDNLVYSTDMAGTNITYKGKGLVTSGSKPGILARLVGLFF